MARVRVYLKAGCLLLSSAYLQFELLIVEFEGFCSVSATVLLKKVLQ